MAKPEPSMLLRVARKHDIDLVNFLLHRRPILVETGYDAKERTELPPTVLVVRNVGTACDWILDRY